MYPPATPQRVPSVVGGTSFLACAASCAANRSASSATRSVGYNEPTVRRYALGEAEVPRIVEPLLNVALYEPTAFAELVKARELPDDEL